MGLKVVPKATAKKPAPKTAQKKSSPAPTYVTKSEAAYQAEDDARTLARAEEIKRDAARLRKAKAIASEEAAKFGRVARA